jgi:sugar porter (SP) family MFS transporter
MMSLINTNSDYLSTMGIAEEDPLVGVIVSIYYLGCAVGAVLASRFADARGRKPGIFACLATASAGNLLMFICGLGGWGGNTALWCMMAGRTIMGLGVGGIDAVVPVYSAELQEDDSRGTALAQEFQANIFGLNMAFIINVVVTNTLGKYNEWAWRIPIIVMQIYPALLFTGANLLPETPRWCVLHGDEDRAKKSIARVFGDDEVDGRIKELTEAHEREEQEGTATYWDMIKPGGSQFHPTVITVMGQVNQALTGYGAVSVYGPQIFELLGFGVSVAEYITLGNYLFYFGMMTVAWMLIDRVGRRKLMIDGAFWLAISFAILTILGGLASNKENLNIPLLATGIPGIVVLYIATSVFGIGWLVPPWLIPTEIYPSTARAQGAAISVIIWGLANFAVTLLTPIGFNNLKYWLFLVFAVTNAFAGTWTWLYCPESGNRTFEENQEFFKEAAEKESWRVTRVRDGEFRRLPDDDGEGDEEREQGDGGKNKKDGIVKNGQSETSPLLGRTDSH